MRQKKILFGVIVTVLFMVVVESLSWVWERYTWLGRQGVHDAMRYDDEDSLYLNNNEGRPQLRPGAHLDGSKFDISINSIGFRGPELTETRPENALRVWCIGGSTTFDIFAPTNEDTWPFRLQEALQGALPDRHVEVVNAGIPGEVLSGSRDDFERFFSHVSPDYLVVYHGPNDLRFAASTDAMPAYEPSLLHAFATFRLLSRWVPIQTVRSEWLSHTIDGAQWSRISRDLRGFVDSARTKGIGVVMATHAHRASDDSVGLQARIEVGEGTTLLQMSPEEVIRSFSRYNEMVTEMVTAMTAQQEIYLADVRSVVPADREYFGDHTHFTPEGSELAAQELARVIVEAER